MYNTTDIRSKAFQPGGTIISSITKPAHRVIDTGVDATGLGRWSWTRYRGKNDVTLRVICAYRPCKKPTSTGPNTAYSQEQQQFSDIQSQATFNIYPRKAFLHDITKDIQQRKEKDKDQLIIMMDCNQDVESDTIQQWATNLGFEKLSLLIIIKHDNQRITEEPNLSMAFLLAAQLPFRHVVTYPLETYPPIIELFGWILNTPMPSGIKYQNHLFLQHVNSKQTIREFRKKWITPYKTFLRQQQAHKRIFTLEMMVIQQGGIDDKGINEYEKIMHIRYQGVKYTDSNCQKVYTGGIAFSEEYKKAELTIAVWKAAKTKKCKAKFSNTKFRHLLECTGIENPLHMSLDAI